MIRFLQEFLLGDDEDDDEEEEEEAANSAAACRGDIYQVTKNNYIGDPKTGHSKTGFIRKPDIFASGFRMVDHSKTGPPFENRTKKRPVYK